MDDALSQEARILTNELSNEATAAASNKNLVNLISSGNSAHHNITNSNILALSPHHELGRHEAEPPTSPSAGTSSSLR